MKSRFVLFVRYIKNMEEQPCCPLCHKDMNANEVDNLTGELNDQIHMFPQNIERSERELKEETKKLEKLLGMQSSVERVEELKSVLLPKVKDEIKDFESKLTTFQEKLKQSQRSIVEPKEKKEIVGKMVGDMALLDVAIKNAKQARKDLEPLKSSLPSSDGQNDNNLDSLQKKRKELTDQMKVLDKNIEKKR